MLKLVSKAQPGNIIFTLKPDFPEKLKSKSINYFTDLTISSIGGVTNGRGMIVKPITVAMLLLFQARAAPLAIGLTNANLKKNLSVIHCQITFECV